MRWRAEKIERGIPIPRGLGYAPSIMWRLPSLIMLSTVLLAGCASSNHYTSWVGHSEDDLLLSWGSPNRDSVRLSDGRVVHTYVRHLRAHPCRIAVVVGLDGAVESVTTNPPRRDAVCYDIGVANTSPPPS